jgi:hypothetical protein
MWKSNLILYSFKEIKLELVDGIWKKKPIGLHKNWNELTESVIKKSDKAIACLTGPKSGILVLDFDDITLYQEFIMKFPKLAEAPRVATRKGFHLYFAWNDRYSELPGKIDKLDIQGKNRQIFYPGTEYKLETGTNFTYCWENDTELFELPSEVFIYLKPKRVKAVSNFVIECNNVLWKKIIENISIKYIDSYQSWFQIISGLYSVGKDSAELDHYKEVARSLSMKSKKYDKSHKEFETIWDTLGKYSFTGGSVRHYSRESNEKEYLKICKGSTGKNSVFYQFDEKLLCDYFLEAFGDNIVCNYNKIYIYINDTWKEDNKGIIIQKFLRKEIVALYKNIIFELNGFLQAEDADTETISKNIKETSKILTNYGNQKNKNIWGLLYSELYSRNIDKEIFDTKSRVFCFNNKAYDLTENRWFMISKFDYILTTCGRDYIEPSKAQVDKIDTIFTDIFPNNDFKRCYISILKTALFGIRIEKFIVATGEGRNGKGLINDLFQSLLGDYYGILPLSLLTKEFKAGANTELRSIHKKRFLKATEPDSGSNEKLRISNIKALTGESNLKARGLYENDFNISILATILLECNLLPYISTDGNEAEKQRLMIVPFQSVFTDNKEDIRNNPDKYKLVNSLYKENEFKEEHACALFKYITDSHNTDELFVPDACKKEALQWILDKDDFVGWFFENYKESADCVVSVKSLYKEFKESCFFLQMPKAQQRQNNEKAFKEMIKGKLKHLFVPTNTYMNGTVITRDSIRGYIKKPKDESDSDSDEPG